jgi:hypothetical protein
MKDAQDDEGSLDRKRNGNEHEHEHEHNAHNAKVLTFAYETASGNENKSDKRVAADEKMEVDEGQGSDLHQSKQEIVEAAIFNTRISTASHKAEKHGGNATKLNNNDNTKTCHNKGTKDDNPTATAATAVPVTAKQTQNN